MNVIPFLVVLISAFVSNFVHSQRVSVDGCWNIWDNTQVTCAQPYHQVLTASLDLCMAVCARDQPRCSGADYDYRNGPHRAVCKLYQGFLPPVGNSRPVRGRGSGSNSRSGSREHRGKGGRRPPPRRRGKRNDDDFNGIQSKHHGGYYGSHRGGSNGRPNRGSFGGQSQCDWQRGAVMKPCGQVVHIRMRPGCTGQTVRPTLPPTLPPTRPPINFPPGTTCSAGEVARLTIIEDFRLVDRNAQEINGVSQTECADICSTNLLPNGDQIACRSASYSFDTCSISLNRAPGTSDLTFEAGTTYYEKICVDDTNSRGCVGPYFVGVQHILVGHASTVISVDSQAECIQQCLDAEIEFGFECLSGIFYADGGAENCILNEVDRVEFPDLYQEVDSEVVNYFETNCGGIGNQQLESNKRRKFTNNSITSILSTTSDWGIWSPCSNNVQKKYRNCPMTMQPWMCDIEMRNCDKNLF